MKPQKRIVRADQVKRVNWYRLADRLVYLIALLSICAGGAVLLIGIVNGGW